MPDGSTPRPIHSPLGASSAERWMHCPGSVRLAQLAGIPEPTDEPDYRAEGTAAHEVAAGCLAAGQDAWEWIGVVAGNGTEITAAIADAVQVYLDHCRAIVDQPGVVWGVEDQVSAPGLHDLFYGTTDFWAWNPATRTLYVRDYKHGEGIVVEVKDNPQPPYYAYGTMRKFPTAATVSLGIIQPRAFHPDGPVRVLETKADDIRRWAEQELRPAMEAADTPDAPLDAGAHCRFCPAKLVCPVMHGMFGAAAMADTAAVEVMDDDALDREWSMIEAVQMYVNVLRGEMMRRLEAGGTSTVAKLVSKRADRVWKDEAKEVLTARFGAEAFTAPALKSPAQFEKIGPEAKALAREWAYTPQTGYTVAALDDKRQAVKPRSAAATFAHMVSAEAAPSQ